MSARTAFCAAPAWRPGGEGFDVAAAVGEVVADLCGAAGIEVDIFNGNGGGGAEAREAQLCERFCPLGRVPAEALGDIGAGTAAAHGESLGQQLVIGEQDDGAGDSELLGQVARGGKAAAGGQCAGQDRMAQPGIDLPEEGLAVF